mmetsp:Transcript_34099/g.106757  ORF Transcript_34099/g.106757 Transcript_34099/m.106757 type:complete len:230 (+) Transcript_34099:298-987(+)
MAFHVGIRLISSEACEGVVDIAVVCLVHAYRKHQIPHRRIRPQVPVVDGNLRGGLGLPVLELAIVDLVDDVGVGLDCLLLEVPDKAMTKARAGDVGDKEEVHKDPLGSNDGCAESVAGLLELDKREQVHALVLSLLEQRVDPSMITIHATKRSEMAEHSCCHSWYRCYCLKEADATDDLGLRELAEAKAREGIEGPAAELDSTERKAVHKIFHWSMSLPHSVDLLVGPD